MKDIEIFPHVSFVDKLLFTKHLSVMIKSGITIYEALDTLESQTKSLSFKKILNSIMKDVENGQSLSKALKKYPKVFDQFYISLIQIGEDSGTLEQNLEFLANQLSKNYNLQKKIKGALLYPLIVLIAAFFIGSAIAIFVLPQLLNLFDTLDVQLPMTTQILIFIANMMKDYGFIIIGGVIGFFIALRLFLQLPFVKPKWHAFLLSLPVLGTFFQNVQLASLFRNLGTMIKSGLTITHALEIQHDLTSNLVFRDYLTHLQQSVTKGKALASELATSRYKKIPSIATKMVSVGEKTGKLDDVFLYLSDFFEEDVDDRAKNFSTLIEPVMLLGIGLIVVFIALAVISPIYQITGSFKR